jgi:hypothetical protein
MRVIYFLTIPRLIVPSVPMINLSNISPNVSLGIFLAASPIAANGMASGA